MAKGLTDEQRQLRFELIDFAAQSIRIQGTNGYYSQEQIEYLTAQLGRVAKFLCLKD